jgi:hypothetical protein
MKKLILSAVVAAFATLSIQAQEIPERKTKESKPILKERIINKKERANLNLTEEQKVKLKSMNQDLRKQMEDLRKQDNLSVKEYREKMETLRKDRQGQFQSILTPEQKTEMQKYKEARSAKVKEFGKKKQAKMKEKLNLTDEQLAKMTENRKATAERIKTIRENDSLKDEQKKEQIKETMKEQKKNMKSFLTEEQLQKMKENRKQHSKRKVVI